MPRTDRLLDRLEDSSERSREVVDAFSEGIVLALDAVAGPVRRATGRATSVLSRGGGALWSLAVSTLKLVVFYAPAVAFGVLAVVGESVAYGGIAVTYCVAITAAGVLYRRPLTAPAPPATAPERGAARGRAGRPAGP